MRLSFGSTPAYCSLSLIGPYSMGIRRHRGSCGDWDNSGTVMGRRTGWRTRRSWHMPLSTITSCSLQTSNSARSSQLTPGSSPAWFSCDPTTLIPMRSASRRCRPCDSSQRPNSHSRCDPVESLLIRRRSCEQIALDLITPDRPQEAHLVGVFDPLGDHTHSERLSEQHYGTSDRGRAAVAR